MGWVDHKNAANALYSEGKTAEAIAEYTEALKCEDISGADRATVLSNRAQCFLKLGEHLKAVEDCTSALTITPDNVKALFRRAVAEEALGEKRDALRDFQEVLRISPGVADANAGVKRLEAALGIVSDDSAAKRSQAGGAAGVTEEDIRALKAAEQRVKDVAAQKAKADSQMRQASQEKRSLEIQIGEVDKLEEGVRSYRAVGKAFLLTPKPELKTHLSDKLSKAEQKVKVCSSTLEYLGRSEKEADAEFLETVKLIDKKRTR